MIFWIRWWEVVLFLKAQMVFYERIGNIHIFLMDLWTIFCFSAQDRTDSWKAGLEWIWFLRDFEELNANCGKKFNLCYKPVLLWNTTILIELGNETLWRTYQKYSWLLVRFLRCQETFTGLASFLKLLKNLTHTHKNYNKLFFLQKLFKKR